MKNFVFHAGRCAKALRQPPALVTALLLLVAHTGAVAQHQAGERSDEPAQAITAAVQHLMMQHDMTDVPFVLVPLRAEARDQVALPDGPRGAARALEVEFALDRPHFVCTERIVERRADCSFPEGFRSVMVHAKMDGDRAVVQIAHFEMDVGSRPIREGGSYVIGSEVLSSVNLDRNAVGVWIVSGVGPVISGIVIGQVGTPR